MRKRTEETVLGVRRRGDAAPARSLVAVASVMAAWLCLDPAPVSNAAVAPTRVRSIKVTESRGDTTIVIGSTGRPTFTTWKLERPARVVVDLSGARLGDVDVPFDAGTYAVAAVSASVSDDEGGVRTRVLFTLRQPSDYKVDAQGNDIVLRVIPHVRPAPAAPAVASEAESRRAAEERANEDAQRAKVQQEARAAEAAAAAQAKRGLAEEKAEIEQRRLRADEATRAAELAGRKLAEERAEAERARRGAEDAQRTAEQASRKLVDEKVASEKARREAEEAQRSAKGERERAERALRDATAAQTKIEERVRTASQADAERARQQLDSARRETERARTAATLATEEMERAKRQKQALDQAQADLQQQRQALAKSEADLKRAQSEAQEEQRRAHLAERQAESARQREVERGEAVQLAAAKVDARTRAVEAKFAKQEEQQQHLAEAERLVAERDVQVRAAAAEVAAREKLAVDASARRTALEKKGASAEERQKAAREATAAAEQRAQAQAAAERSRKELAEAEGARKAVEVKKKQIESERTAEERKLKEAVAARTAEESRRAAAEEGRRKEEERLTQSQAGRARVEAERKKLEADRDALLAEVKRLKAHPITLAQASPSPPTHASAAQAASGPPAAKTAPVVAPAPKSPAVASTPAVIPPKPPAAASTRPAVAPQVTAKAAPVPAKGAPATATKAAPVPVGSPPRATLPVVAATKPVAPPRPRSVTLRVPCHVERIDFVDEPSRSTVIIDLDEPSLFAIQAFNGHQVTMRLLHAELPSNLERSVDATEYLGPVRLISTYRDPEARGTVRIDVELADDVPNKVRRDGNRLYWDFQKRIVNINGFRTAKTFSHVSASETMPRMTLVRAPRVAGFRIGPWSALIAQQTGPSLVPATGAVGGGAGASTFRPGGALKKRYTGRRVDLDFKGADIHNILRLLSDVGQVNIVVADDVKGDVTIKMRDVPWDQALDVVLRGKQLGSVREGNLIRVAPLTVLEKELEQEIARQKQITDVLPTETRLIGVSYADARNLQDRAKDLLSTRGKISVDDRTNNLIVSDVAKNLALIEELVRNLDTQTSQVVIEARIVEARSTFVRQIGVQWGGTGFADAEHGNPTGLAFPYNIGIGGGAADGQTPTGGLVPAPRSGLAAANPNFAVNLPVAAGTGAGGALGLTLGSVAGAFNLNLRLTALESTGQVRILSSPRITTMDNTEASIEQGVAIPISVVSAQGVQTVFVDAKLNLTVKPHVTNEGTVMLNVAVTRNEPDFVNTGARGDPTILKKEAKTSMLIRDGDTAVIGGIYTRNSGLNYAKVPFFADIPIVGTLFRSRRENDDRTEFLVFITPRIANRARALGQ